MKKERSNNLDLKMLNQIQDVIVRDPVGATYLIAAGLEFLRATSSVSGVDGAAVDSLVEQLRASVVS